MRTLVIQFRLGNSWINSESLCLSDSRVFLSDGRVDSIDNRSLNDPFLVTGRDGTCCDIFHPSVRYLRRVNICNRCGWIVRAGSRIPKCEPHTTEVDDHVWNVGGYHETDRMRASWNWFGENFDRLWDSASPFWRLPVKVSDCYGCEQIAINRIRSAKEQKRKEQLEREVKTIEQRRRDYVSAMDKKALSKAIREEVVKVVGWEISRRTRKIDFSEADFARMTTQAMKLIQAL